MDMLKQIKLLSRCKDYALKLKFIRVKGTECGISYCDGHITPYMMSDGWMNEVVERIYIYNSTKVFSYVNSLIGKQETVDIEQISKATGVSECEVEKILDGLLEEY